MGELEVVLDDFGDDDDFFLGDTNNSISLSCSGVEGLLHNDRFELDLAVLSFAEGSFMIALKLKSKSNPNPTKFGCG